MKKVLFLAIVSFAGCFSCVTRETEIANDGEMLTVTIGDIPMDAVDLTGCVDSVRQILLETSDDILVGSISQIIVQDDWIALLDGQIRSVHMFDMDGNFIRSFGRVGRGPGEYMDMTKLMFNEQKEQFMVYDGSRRALLFHDIEGNHIKTIEGFGDMAPLRDIIELPSGNFLCSRFDRAGGAGKEDLVGVWETDPEGKFIRYLFHEPNKYPTIFSRGFYYLYNSPDGGVGYFDHNSGDVFSFKGDSMFRKIQFEFPGQKTAKDFIGQDFDDDNTQFVMLGSAYHKGGYIFSGWDGSDRMPFVSLVSTKTGEVKTGRAFPNLIKGKVTGIGMTPNNSTNIATSILPAQTILMMNNNEQLPQDFRKALDELVGDKTEDEIAQMNPVITMLYIKD